jgi:hypothetical protein
MPLHCTALHCTAEHYQSFREIIYLERNGRKEGMKWKEGRKEMTNKEVRKQ